VQYILLPIIHIRNEGKPWKEYDKSKISNEK